MKTIGVIAGNGRFPLLAVEEAKKQGYRAVVAAIQKEAEPQVEKYADACRWLKIGELKKLASFFKGEEVHEALMAGKVEKVRLFQENVHPDLGMIKVLMKTRDFKDDSLLSGIANYLESEGIRLLDSTFFLKDALPGSGALGKKKPNSEMWENIRFGYEVAKKIAGMDLGQTVVVKKKAVLAVEAIEGTDQTIRRGGELGGGKVTVVKVAKPNQDMRFDVPAVGLRTVESLIAARAEVFAFEASKTLFFDKNDFIDRANHKGIAVVGVDGAEL